MQRWTVAVLSIATWTACNADAPGAAPATGSGAAPKLEAQAPAVTGAAPSPPAQQPQPQPKPFDAKEAIIGKWVGDSVLGTATIPAATVKQLRLVIEAEHMTRANPGQPVSKLRYAVKAAEGRKVTVGLEGIAGDMTMEISPEGNLLLGQPGTPVMVAYVRGTFDVQPVFVAAQKKQPWVSPAVEQPVRESAFCTACTSGQRQGRECSPCLTDPMYAGTGSTP